MLAQELGIEVWTGDERMFNNLSSVAPWVRWIGDYESDDGDG